jgi:hypothetical protein
LAYERYLDELEKLIGDAERVRQFMESDHWKLVDAILKSIETNSERDFIEGECTPEQHRANIVAVRMLRRPLEQVATASGRWVEEKERLEKMARQARRRSAISTVGLG